MEIFGHIASKIILATGFALGVLCAVHALLHKREPNSALIWVSLCLSIPILGSLLYIVLGFNRIHRHAAKLMLRSKRNAGPATLSSPAGLLAQAPFHQQGDDDKIKYPTENTEPSMVPESPVQEGEQEQIFAMEVPTALMPARIRTMARIGYATMGMPLIAGNQVDILYNGEQAYPAMLEAISRAEKCIYLDTYIFDNDKVGKAFVEELAAAKARGVEVKVQVDGTGTLLTRPRIDKALAKRGVVVARFIPPRLFPPQLSINLRNHRKLLLVDGKVGFTGGMNISSVHIMGPEFDQSFRTRIGLSKAEPMQDIHFRVQGPILEDLQLIFGREWQFTFGEVLDLPPVAACSCGRSLCRTILDGPDDYLERFHSTLLGTISAAKSRVHIMTPYFLPSRSLITALQSAAMRGVDVAVILPDKVDHRFIRWATTNILWEFVGRGVHIYYQPAPFNHSKLLLIDGYYSHIGSANLDPRSLRLNFELTMEVFDLCVARELERHFADIRDKSREYTERDLKERSLLVRLRDAAFWLGSPYM